MTTWNAEDAPHLGPLNFWEKIRGTVRITLLVLATGLAVGLFLLGRGLRAVFGDWIVFHFGVARAWARTCLWLAGLRLVVVGTPIPQGILAANHSSWLDILALRAVTLIYFVSKAEVANWPGVGFITRITGTVFIERRRSHAKQQEAMLRDRIQQHQLLCMFPEGTSTDGLRVLDFKTSLFSALFEDGKGAEIQAQPVTLRYYPEDQAGLPDSFYGWWGEMGFEAHIWDVVTRSRNGAVKVIFHPPVLASEFEDRKLLTDHCHRSVAQGMQTGRIAEIAAPPGKGKS
ncbi:MAG: lysophospholipid acyltransferase family protein [Pseudomonadota bacterium]